MVSQDHRSEDGARARLAIVTCGPQLEIALDVPHLTTRSVVRLGGVTPRSTLVLAAIDLVVEDAGISPADLGLIVVSRGPGSFTGIRAGLATALGLAAANGAECVAYDSLLMLAARCDGEGVVWAAQPGRRGEVYAASFEIRGSEPPAPGVGVEIVAVDRLGDRGPWVAAEALDIGDGRRNAVSRGSAEALLHLQQSGVPPQTLEPMYVEGPPIHRASKGS